MTLEEKFEILKSIGYKYLSELNGYNKVDTDNWKIELGNTKRFLGMCAYKNKTIYISGKYLELNDVDKMKATLLHEIAHVLTPKNGHKGKFIEVCNMLGTSHKCKNEDKSIIKPERKIKYKCPNCGKIYSYHRSLKRKASCGICCKTFNPEYLLIKMEI